MESLYQFARIVDNSEVPRTGTDLSAKILRPVDPEFAGMPLSIPEKKLKEWLDRQPHDVTVADTVRQFAKVPYGWSDFATIYYLNELVRRHVFAFNYNNNPNVTREDTARNIVRDATKFSIERAKAISQELLNSFIDAWKDIFNVVTVKGSNDSTELFRNCKETEDSALNRLLGNYRSLSHKIAGKPFAHIIEEAITLMEQWLTVRDPQKFFETIIAAREEASILFDQCKNVNTFAHDQYEGYEKILKFIDDNRDNFSFLDADQQPGVEALRGILTDEEPWKNMPSYTKLMRNLGGQLNAKKTALVQEIKTKLNATFDDLEQYAQAMGVDRSKFANRENTIARLTSTNNFYALVGYTRTSEFYGEQMTVINNSIPAKPKPEKPESNPKPTEEGHGDKAGENPPVPPTPQKVRKVVKLIKPKVVLRSEEDVNNYLLELKDQLMETINAGDEIVIN